jgi:DNA-binding LytR/AlgR family response regulator
MWKEYRNDERYKKLVKQVFRGASPGRLITLKTETREEMELNLDDLYYISAEDNYSRVHYLEGDRMKERLLRITLKNLETQFDDPDIIRCHRSYIINLAKPFSIRGDASGYSLISDQIGEQIPISRSKGKEITTLLKSKQD